MDRRARKDALFEAFAEVGKAMSSGRRIEILDVLAQGPRSVEDIAAELHQPLANASHHLRVLAGSGLVRARRDGRHVIYALAGDAVGELWAAAQRAASEHVADVERLAADFLGDRDSLEEVSRAELVRRLRRAEVTVLDVRPSAEFASGHIRGARSVPLADLRRRLRDLPRDVEVVAYCRGPYCVMADEAVRMLTRGGFRARRLQDGFPQWRREGLPVAAGAER